MRIISLVFAVFTLSASGCAAQGYYDGSGYATNPAYPTYVQPAPVYAVPTPVYRTPVYPAPTYVQPGLAYSSPQVLVPRYATPPVGYYDNESVSSGYGGYYRQPGYISRDYDRYQERRGYENGRRYPDEAARAQQADVQRRQQQYNQHVADLQTQHNQNVVGLQQQFNQGRINQQQLQGGYRQLETNLNRGISNEQRALPH